MAAGIIAVAAPSASTAPVAQPWHLDRINQRALPLDGDVSRGPLTGAGVTVYVVDSGVNMAHEQFGGRALPGIDLLTSYGSDPVTPPGSDCDGHGTHVAALAGGSTVGVAPGATVVSVRVLDCGGEGRVPDVVEVLRWVRSHHRGGTPAVVNLSLGVDMGEEGETIDRQVRALLAEGVVVTIAAGNGDAYGRYDSCNIAPAHVAGALTVGAVAVNDSFASYSGFGPCVDILAPGGTSTTGLESAWIGGVSAYGFDAGTSMASPLVAGYAALLAQQQPGLCADDISDAIVARATVGAVTSLDATTANRLLFVDTAPVAAGTPGEPSHVVTTTSASSLTVSWDPPCDGGSPLESTAVSLLRNGRVVRRATVPAGVTTARFAGLVPGSRYSVVVKARNALGEGAATPRHATPTVQALRAGRTVAVSSLARFGGDLKLKWNVAASSARVCRLSGNRSRITFLRPGTCRVALRTATGVAPVLRNLRVS